MSRGPRLFSRPSVGLVALCHELPTLVGTFSVGRQRRNVSVIILWGLTLLRAVPRTSLVVFAPHNASGFCAECLPQRLRVARALRAVC